MAISRRSQLLLAAADALGDGRDPLSTGFLSDHQVTLTECHQLAGDIGDAIRSYVASARHPGLAAAMACATAEDKPELVDQVLAAAALHGIAGRSRRLG
jgi:hypothetical protein